MPDPDDPIHATPDAVIPPTPARRTGDELEGDLDDDEPTVGAGDLGALMGGLDLGSLLDLAGQMQEQLVQAQAEADATVLEGAAGGGMVKVAVTGGGDFISVTIDPEVVDPADVEMLQDLVLAALHDAMAQVRAVQGPGAGGALGGLPDLGSLGDLFGGGE
jgi:DNA-binding YbaB/EbfC family protein